MNFRAANEVDKKWFCEALSYHPTEQFSGIVAEDSNRIMGMIGMDFWTPKSVQLHVYILDAKCTLPIWAQVVQYLRSHGKRLAIGVTPSNIEKALKLIWRLGFVEKYRIVNGWDDGVDMVISEYEIHEQQRSVAA